MSNFFKRTKHAWEENEYDKIHTQKPTSKTEWQQSELAKTYEEMKAKFERLDELEKKTVTQELIIQGLEEGSEQWKAEYDNCRKLLQELVDLKELKDKYGKTELYLSRQPKAWDAAKNFLTNYQHESW